MPGPGFFSPAESRLSNREYVDIKIREKLEMLQGKVANLQLHNSSKPMAQTAALLAKANERLSEITTEVKNEDQFIAP